MAMMMLSVMSRLKNWEIGITFDSPFTATVYHKLRKLTLLYYNFFFILHQYLMLGKLTLTFKTILCYENMYAATNFDNAQKNCLLLVF